MISLEDFKVFCANTMCMIVLSADTININLQSILFLSTIIYTIIRIINEIKKFRHKKYDNPTDKEEVRGTE
jgi:hypothetical protein